MAEATHIPDLLAAQAAAHPERAAVSVTGAEPLTYGQWWARSTAAARALRAKVPAGSVIALPFGADEWPAYAVAYVACQLAGSVPAPVRAGLSGSEWNRLADMIGAVLAEGADLPGDLPAGLSGERRFVLSDLVNVGEQSQSQPQEQTQPDLPAPDRAAHVIFTSGTTGEPKAVVVEHAELLAGSSLPAGWAGQALVHAMAPAATAGTEGALLLALKTGLHATTVTPLEPGRLADRIAAPDTRAVLLAPSVAQLVLAGGRLPATVEHVRLVMLMGSACPPAVLAELADRFPRGRVLSHYGATEAGAAQLLMPYDPRRPFAAGRPIGATGVRIVRDGRDLPVGEIGEVLLRREGVPQRRYLRGAATVGSATVGSETTASDTARSDTVFVDDGWVRTGDLGRLDEHGYLFLMGREKDLVIRAGQNIVPREAEQALLAIDAVRDAAAFGVSHELWGEMLVAAVVTEGDDWDPTGLRRELRTTLASYKVPSRLFRLDAIPRTAAGKPDVTQLRADYTAVAGR